MSEEAPKQYLKSSKLRMKTLKQENEVLRKRLGMKNLTTLEEWMLNPQEIRDQMAARALMAEWGRVREALVLLGFIQTDDYARIPKDQKQRFKLAKVIFQTPGCQELLLRHLQEVDDNKGAILSRLQQVALHAADGEAVRAAQVISKMSGWQKTPDMMVDNRRMTFVQLLGNERSPETKPMEALEGTVDSVDFLCHEPGEPVRIDSGNEDIYKALEE